MEKKSHLFPFIDVNFGSICKVLFFSFKFSNSNTAKEALDLQKSTGALVRKGIVNRQAASQASCSKCFRQRPGWITNPPLRAVQFSRTALKKRRTIEKRFPGVKSSPGLLTSAAFPKFFYGTEGRVGKRGAFF